MGLFEYMYVNVITVYFPLLGGGGGGGLLNFSSHKGRGLIKFLQVKVCVYNINKGHYFSCNILQLKY